MASFKVPKIDGKFTEKINTPVEQRKEYSETWLEWASKNRTQLCLWTIYAGGGSTTVYTVPEGYSFLITSACIAITANDGIQVARLWKDAQNSLNVFLTCGRNNSLSCSYPMPIKVNSLQPIGLSAGAACEVSVIGFLEQNQA